MYAPSFVKYLLLIFSLLLFILVIGNRYRKYKEQFINYPIRYPDAGDNYEEGVLLAPGIQKYDLRGFPTFNRPLYDCWNDDYRNCYNSNF